MTRPLATAQTTSRPATLVRFYGGKGQYRWLRSPVTLSAAVAAVAIFIALMMSADTIATILRLHSPLPYFDEWDSLNLFRELISGQLPWTEIFSQHNEHRIFVPRLFLFSDYLFFGGRGLLDGVTILLIQAVHISLLIWLLRRSRPAVAGSLSIAAVIVILLTSLRQEENFSWDFQVSFVSVFAAATLTCVLFSDAMARFRKGLPSLALFSAAYGCAFVATYTMANGLIVSVILFCLAVVTRAEARIITSAAMVMSLLAVFYLHGYEVPPQHTPLGFSAHHPMRFLGYLATYLGNFLDPNIWPALLLGLWGILGLIAAAWRIVVFQDRNPVRLTLFAVMMFTTVSAIVTALGRVGFGIEQAFSSRYSTGSGTFWSASLIFWWSLADRRRVGALLRAAIGLTALVLVYGAVFAQGAMKDGMEERAYQQREATNALLIGLKDSSSFDGVYGNDNTVVAGAAFLKSKGLSIFDGGDSSLVGRPITDAGRLVGDSACIGSIEVAEVMPDLGENGSRVSGKAWSRRGNRLTDEIYLTDGNEKVVGFATPERSSQDPSSWHGFAISPAGTTLRAFVRLRGGAICPIGHLNVAK